MFTAEGGFEDERTTAAIVLAVMGVGRPRRQMELVQTDVNSCRPSGFRSRVSESSGVNRGRGWE